MFLYYTPCSVRTSNFGLRLDVHKYFEDFSPRYSLNVFSLLGLGTCLQLLFYIHTTRPKVEDVQVQLVAFVYPYSEQPLGDVARALGVLFTVSPLSAVCKIKCQSQYALSMFLSLGMFQPRHSNVNGSYKKKKCVPFHFLYYNLVD